MRMMQACRIVLLLATSLATSDLHAELKAELVDTKIIWDQAPHNAYCDLARFGDRWFCVCRESSDLHANSGVIRVQTSQDAQQWESAARIGSPIPDRGLTHPKLSATPDGQLLLTAAGSSPQTTLQTFGWTSKDGRFWSPAAQVGELNYWYGRIIWHQGIAFSYGYGCICGIAQTVQIIVSKDGRQFEGIEKHTISGTFPKAGGVLIEGDMAYCIMTRVGERNLPHTALLGTAAAPFVNWQWKETELRICDPNLIRLPDGTILAVAGRREPRACTMLAEFDPKTARLRELLELPNNAQVSDAGLVHHAGQLWISYDVTKGNRTSIHLAQVKLVRE